MAVYTQITETQARAFLSDYSLGALISLRPIEAGVSNTNYHLETDKGRFILTLYEPHRVRPEDVPFFVTYTDWLEKSGIPSPRTQVRKDGDRVGILNGRPATIVSFLEGEEQSVSTLDAGKCSKAGELLARMHLAVQGWPEEAPNLFSLPCWEDWVETLCADMNRIASGLDELTRDELAHVEANWPSGLPRGAIHADYFPDNVFFKGDVISGVIDFHFVCTDFFAYDLAIAMNAWAFDEKNEFNRTYYKAMLDGYQSVRPLVESESKAFPVLLRASALRFLLSRIEEKLNWKPGDFMVPHDPLVFLKRLQHWRDA